MITKKRLLLSPFSSRHILKAWAPAILSSAAIGTLPQPAKAVSFNFSFQEGTPSDVIKGVEQAGALWGSALLDDVVVNLNVEFGTLPAGYLGGSRPEMVRVGYADAIAQFGLDQASADDRSAFSYLPKQEAGSGVTEIPRLINQTADGWFHHTDTSINTLWLTRANAKSLGLLAGADIATDGTIRLSNQSVWDFDPDNGIKSNRYDFVGTVLHEIGHSLGFLSGVDVLDANAKQNIQWHDEAYDFITSMDLFRHSLMTAGKGNIDWTVDSDTEYFSLDGGRSKIAEFTNGSSALFNADYFQMSHFKEGTQSVMSPTLAKGQRSSLTGLDLRLMDAIGWDLSAGGQVNYQLPVGGSGGAETKFDGALSSGSWSSTNYGSFLWQSQTSSGPTQKVPEPSALFGCGVIALLAARTQRAQRQPDTL